MTNPTAELHNVIGKDAVDNDGSKIGKVGQIYLNDQTGQPEWVTVQTGLFGRKESFAPLYGSHADGETLTLAVSKDIVKDAPSVDSDEHMEQDEADALFAYYQGYFGSGDAERDDDERRDRAQDADVQGHDTSGPTTDDAMTRSQERIDVGTETVQTGQARLRKYVVEENVTQTVPVRHEEVRLEREPITDANRGDAVSGADMSEEEHEITLHAERPTVSKETVPVERVKLGTETVTTDAQVDETVRKEQIDSPNVPDEHSQR